MGFDYYSILRVPRTCDKSGIKKAYRRFALKYNPERHENDPDMKQIFTLISEAYDVLVNPETRAVFDQYGEEGLKSGVPGPHGYIPPYVYHGEPTRTYEEFFGTANPYADLLSYYETLPSTPLGKGYKEKDNVLVQPLALSLTEVFNGGVKKMKIHRLVFTNEKCDELKLREKILSIPITRGMYPNTEIRFKEEGDQGPSKIPADVVFVTEDRPHPLFTRVDRLNLLMVQRVTLEEALCGISFTVPTLDERSLRVTITDVITPKYEKVIENEGLPNPACPDKYKGNLIIRFSIQFPTYISKKAKHMFKEAFKVAQADHMEYEE